jgi:LPXTG-site transpeptidase (sortase) family protein
MEGFVHITARLVRAARDAYARKWTFLGVFVLAFYGSVFTLGALDLLPNPSVETPVAAVSDSATTSPLVAAVISAPAVPASAETPVKLEIPSIGLSTSVADPVTTDISSLDALLLNGAVRYPTSALLGEAGNVVIFGHSSYLPIVKNQAYKTFDGIQKLKAGDTITVYSADAAYTYAVRGVEKESATSAAIPLSVSGQVLTLSTCDSFGAKTDRFVVTADFVSSHPIMAS